jgi:hypothetical protein
MQLTARKFAPALVMLKYVPARSPGTVENRTDRVSVYGSIDLTRNKRGLEYARALGSLVDSVIKAIEAEKQLPE